MNIKISFLSERQRTKVSGLMETNTTDLTSGKIRKT